MFGGVSLFALEVAAKHMKAPVEPAPWKGPSRFIAAIIHHGRANRVPIGPGDRALYG